MSTKLQRIKKYIESSGDYIDKEAFRKEFFPTREEITKRKVENSKKRAHALAGKDVVSLSGRVLKCHKFLKYDPKNGSYYQWLCQCGSVFNAYYAHVKNDRCSFLCESCRKNGRPKKTKVKCVEYSKDEYEKILKEYMK